MIIDILTLFPSMFDGFLNNSIIKRAIENDKIKINIHNIRDYSPYKNKFEGIKRRIYVFVHGFRLDGAIRKNIRSEVK